MKRIDTLGLYIASAMAFNDKAYLFGVSNKKVNPNYNKEVKIPQQRKLIPFNINDEIIEAYSRKDAIKRYNHRNK